MVNSVYVDEIVLHYFKVVCFERGQIRALDIDMHVHSNNSKKTYLFIYLFIYYVVFVFFLFNLSFCFYNCCCFEDTFAIIVIIVNVV